MEFQQLEMFAAVVDEGSVQRAAGRVSRTAPAVSIALRKLEEEVGSPLFDKSQRYNYLLTPSGELLYSYARQILKIRNEAVSALQDLSHNRRTTLSIGAHESTSLYLLPMLTEAFHRTSPELKIEVLCDNPARVLDAVRDRQVELGLLAITPDDDDLEKNLLMTDEVVLIAGPAHRLAGVSRLEIKALADEFLILVGATSSLRERVIQAFAHAGVRPNIGVENASIETMKRMVAAGIGIGFAPLMCVREEERREELIVLRVNGMSHKRDLWLVHRKDRTLSKAARAFLAVSLSMARSLDHGPSAAGNERNTRVSSQPSGNRSPAQKRVSQVSPCRS